MSTTPKSNRTTHTPGPWRLVGREVLGRDFTGTYRLICKVSGGSPEHADGNARLIAVATELLQLAHQYRDDMRHVISTDSRSRRLSWIEDILAKASGSR